MEKKELENKFLIKLNLLSKEARFILKQFRLTEFYSFYQFFVTEGKTIDFSKHRNCGYKLGKELNNMIGEIILHNAFPADHREVNDAASPLLNISSENFTQKAELEFDKKFDELPTRAKNVISDINANNINDFFKMILQNRNFDFSKLRNCGTKTQNEIIAFAKDIQAIVDKDEDEIKQSFLFKDIEHYLFAGQVLKKKELPIVLNYYSFIQGKEYKSLRRIAEELNLSTERVRQLSITVIEKLKRVVEKLSVKGTYNLQKYYQEDYFIVTEAFTKSINESENTNFSSEFITYVLSWIRFKNFKFILINEKNTLYSGVLINNSIPFNFEKCFEFLSQYVSIRRKQDVIIKVDDLNKKFSSSRNQNLFPNAHEQNLIERIRVLEVFKLFIKLVFSIEKDIEITSDLIVFKRTTKKLKYEYISDILNEYKKPMHFTEIYKECLKRQIKMTSAESIHGIIQHYPKIFGLKGPGIYGLIEWGGYFGTIGDVAEQLIKEKNEPMNKKELVNILCRELYISQDSINTVLFFYEPEQRFIKLKNDKIGLKEWLTK